MTQSLQRIDILVDHGSGLGLFVWLSILVIPSLLSVIIPFSVFGAAIYTLQRLHSDSEIAVIFAAGIGRWRIAAPLLFIATIAASITLWVNLDLMPQSYRILKFRVADIRADFASAVLRSGEFTTIIDGLTIYVEEARPGGQFVGLLISDYRDTGEADTYLAQKGLLLETDQGPVLQLLNGSVQTVSEDSGEIEIVNFENTSLNIADFQNAQNDFQLELTERYLSELLTPDLSNDWERENAGKLIAEGHNRLTSPLYAIVYALLAVYALIGGAYNRRGYSIKIALACAVAGAIRIFGFIVQGLSAQSGAYWMQYAIPITAIIILAFLITNFSRKNVSLTKPNNHGRKKVGRKTKKATKANVT